MSGILGWVMGAAALAAAYWLFVGQVSPGEALAAVPAVCVGLWFAVLHHWNARHEGQVGAADLGPLKTVPGALARDTARVGLALARGVVRPVTGVFISEPIGSRGPAETGVAVLADSVAPNAYVIDAAGDRLVLHRLAP